MRAFDIYRFLRELLLRVGFYRVANVSYADRSGLNASVNRDERSTKTYGARSRPCKC